MTVSPRLDASGVPVGKVAVPKIVQKPPLPREDAPEMLVCRAPVPKTGQKPSSPRRDAPEAIVGKVAVPKTGLRPSLPRGDATETLVGKVAVPMDLPRTQSGPRPADRCSDLTDWFRLLNVLYLGAQDNSETV